MSENYILDEIKSPDDVKKLPESSLTELADEIRRTIIETTSKNGGHLASNLGMVEPSSVLHRVFDCIRHTRTKYSPADTKDFLLCESSAGYPA